MEKFKWVYIGSGGIARTTANNIVGKRHEIVAVYSRNFNTAKAFADRYKAKAYETAQEAICHSGADAVYIATPHTSHVEYAKMALERGIPVLCEKPVGVSADDVEELIRTAKENNTYFAEAMWTWFSPVALKVKEWVKAGRIGDVTEVVIHHAYPGLSKAKDSRVRNPMTAGGALLDIGIYPITYCYNIFGYPDEIFCDGELEDGIDIAENVTLRYGKSFCFLHMNFRYLKEDCVIKGTKGTIKVPLFHVSPAVFLKSGVKIRAFAGKTDYLTEFDRVAEEIRSGKKESEYIPFEATLNCMRIMDECRKIMGLKYPFEK